MKLLFLEASDSALIRRFSETRRPHPLAGDRSVAEGLTDERRLLLPLRRLADKVLDTSNLTVHELRRVIRETTGGTESLSPLVVTFLSFGFRRGVPTDADLVFDVRFLPNPHFVEALRPFTGRHPRVARLRAADEGSEALHRAHVKALRVSRAAVHRGGEGVPDDCDRLHRRASPVGRAGRNLRQAPAVDARHSGARQAP